MNDIVSQHQSVSRYVEPYEGFKQKLAKSRALMGGTESMRKARTKYLPKFDSETEKHYENRLNMSFLFNAFRKTVSDMSNRVFSESVEIDNENNELFAEYSKDIDLEGNTITMFAKMVFESSLQSGIEYLMVDAPPKADDETRYDVMQNNLRPYIIHIKAENALGWKTSRINGRHVLSQFRFMEIVNESKVDDEFQVEVISQVRVLDLHDGYVQSRVFRKNQFGEYKFHSETFIEIDEIPIVPFYAYRKDYFKGEPVLEDLADLNIAHWQSQSDQRNILHYTRVPILFAKGIGDDTEVPLSVSQYTYTSNDNADLKWVEHNGNSIKAGKEDLEHIELLMQYQGLQLLTTQTMATATGELRNETKEVSKLIGIVQSEQDALQKCFVLMGHFIGVSFEGKVRLNKDIAVARISQNGLTILFQSLIGGKISRETFWQELQRYGLLRDTFDPELEKQLIEDDEALVDDLPFVDDE